LRERQPGIALLIGGTKVRTRLIRVVIKHRLGAAQELEALGKTLIVRRHRVFKFRQATVEQGLLSGCQCQPRQLTFHKRIVGFPREHLETCRSPVEAQEIEIRDREVEERETNEVAETRGLQHAERAQVVNICLATATLVESHSTQLDLEDSSPPRAGLTLDKVFQQPSSRSRPFLIAELQSPPEAQAGFEYWMPVDQSAAPSAVAEQPPLFQGGSFDLHPAPRGARFPLQESANHPTSRRRGLRIIAERGPQNHQCDLCRGAGHSCLVPPTRHQPPNVGRAIDRFHPSSQHPAHPRRDPSQDVASARQIEHG
jgi:hypothetical protein